jgi:hypothetical protein
MQKRHYLLVWQHHLFSQSFSKIAILEGQTFGGPSLVIVINMAQV